MDRIPQEIVRLIVEKVAYESLEPLRLVNKAFAAAAAPFLFEVIPLWISVRSLERLTAISEHSQLCQYPKRIVFSPIRFIEYNEPNLYKRKVKDWLEYQPASLSVHALALAKHTSAHRSYIEAQRLLALESLDVKIMSRAFSQLPHLEIVHVDYWDTAIGSNELIHAFGAFKAETLITCDCRYTLPTLIKALAASSANIRVFKLCNDEEFSYSSHSGSVADYTAAASLARPRLPPSMNTYSRPAKISAQALAKTFCDETFEICRNAFCGVRELEIGEMLLEQDDPVNLQKIVAALQQLMGFARCLETVTLGEIRGHPFLDLSKPAMDRVMPYHGLNHIKKLNVQHYDTTLTSLISFFRLHNNTIIEVDFHFVTITGSDWSTALVQLRTIHFPRLKVFMLNYCDDQEADLQVQDYILKETDEDPIVEDTLEREREQEETDRQRQQAAMAV